MFFHPHLQNSRLGFLAIFGFIIIVLTETGMRALPKGASMTAPHSWWLLSGYVVAGAYCILIHAFITWRETRLGYESPGADHTLARVPIRYWSIIYLFFGFIRLTAVA